MSEVTLYDIAEERMRESASVLQDAQDELADAAGSALLALWDQHWLPAMSPTERDNIARAYAKKWLTELCRNERVSLPSKIGDYFDFGSEA